jgi:hypothetical protein
MKSHPPVFVHMMLDGDRNGVLIPVNGKKEPANPSNPNFKYASPITSLIILSSVFTCGLALPVWALVALIVYIVNKAVPAPPPIIPKVIQPSNEFASDWQFKIYTDEELARFTDVDG